MVEFLDESRGNLLAVRITKVVDKHSFKAFNPELEKVVDDYDDPRIYLELSAFDKVTPRAIFEDITNLPTYNKFKKIAVVGDAKWKEILIEVTGVLMSPTTKYFSLEEKEKAISWVKM